MEFMSWEIALITGIIILPVLIYLYLSKRRRSAIKFSSVSLFNGVKPSFKHKLRHIPFVLFIMGLISLLIALARPRIGDELAVDYTEGIAIQMVLDRSSSMINEPVIVNMEQKTYLDVAKDVAIRFIEGDDTLSGRSNDIIGLSSFAGFVQENCPMTLDHKNLAEIIKQVRPALSRTKEDGTAIGDAIFHSVLSLVSAEDYYNKDSSNDYSIKSKIMILLTDGFQTAGEREIKSSAEFSKENDIKVYTILFAGKSLKKAINMGDRRVIAEINQLEDAAKITDGKFFLAYDNKSLQSVYQEIDKLEKSDIKEEYFRYNEQFHFFLILGFVLLLIEMILSETVFRRLP